MNDMGTAKELIGKALDIQTGMADAERIFNADKAKYDKELGRTLNRLRNLAADLPLDHGEEEKVKGKHD